MTKILILFVSLTSQMAWSQQDCKSLIDSKVSQISGINKSATQTVNKGLASMNTDLNEIDSIIDKLELPLDDKRDAFMGRFKRVISIKDDKKFEKDLSILLNFAPNDSQFLKGMARQARKSLLGDTEFQNNRDDGGNWPAHHDAKVNELFEDFYRGVISKKYVRKNSLLELKVAEFDKNFPFESAGVEYLQRRNIDFDSMKVIGGSNSKSVTVFYKGNSVVAIGTRDGNKSSLTRVSATSCKPFAALYMQPEGYYKYIGGSSCNKLNDANKLSRKIKDDGMKVTGYEKFEAFLDSNGTFLSPYPRREDYDVLTKLCKSVPQGWENGNAVQPREQPGTVGQPGATIK